MKISKFIMLMAMIHLGTSGSGQENEFKKLNVAVFVYDGVEILDFSGPAEVFATSGFLDEKGKYQVGFNVYTVAVSKSPIISQGFLKVIPDYDVDNCPLADIVVLPGGSTKKSRENPKVIEWIKNSAENKATMLSVCTGAYLLGDAGLLKGLSATTWYGQISRLKETYPETTVLENVRFVDNGHIITTAGVSAGIDGALHIVSRLFGNEAAASTAEYMEYDKWDANDGVIINKE